jgi:hypothetical protein
MRGAMCPRLSVIAASGIGVLLLTGCTVALVGAFSQNLDILKYGLGVAVACVLALLTGRMLPYGPSQGP